ncbi:LysE family translocator [Roseovarius sp. M141]|uniref:LysE family translocator n=1 Tax=Roseovarius sp. M141 TaxID=2583806 RepID=UPI0020CCAF1C|nr:LysE family translocator [Roseovarius sp. M141]MCQ0094104.1 LysE family translocator [Roseovarius sp. M141]
MQPLILPLLIFLFPLAFSPGPGNMVFAAAGARFGLRATLPANAGYHLATLAVTILIGLGFAEAMNTFPGLFAVIKVAGSLYVLWLAATLMRAGLNDDAEARPVGFGDGVILLLLNPKAYIIIALMFTQFLTDQGRSGLWTVVAIAAIFTLNNLAAFLTWTIFGDVIARRFREGGRARNVNIVFGAMLGAAGLWILIH